MLLLIVSGLHRYLVAAIVETYNAIPVGGVKFSSTIYTDILKFVSEYFVIGFRIALPVFAVIFAGKLYSCHYGEGFTANEYVCSRYPVKIICRTFGDLFYNFHLACGIRLHIGRNRNHICKDW